MCIYLNKTLTWYTEFQEFIPITVVWLAGSAVADVSITVMLVFYLVRHKTVLRGIHAEV